MKRMIYSFFRYRNTKCVVKIHVILDLFESMHFLVILNRNNNQISCERKNSSFFDTNDMFDAWKSENIE